MTGSVKIFGTMDTVIYITIYKMEPTLAETN